jgi:hypothetical protein
MSVYKLGLDLPGSNLDLERYLVEAHLGEEGLKIYESLTRDLVRQKDVKPTP